MVPQVQWTLSTALAFIRAHQARSMEAGWCLTLGGSVLNEGESRNDLDVVVYPRTRRSTRDAFVELFPFGAWDTTPVGKIYSVEVNGKLVEFAFVTGLWEE